MLILYLPLLALTCAAAVLLRRRPAAARRAYRAGIAAAVLPYLLHLHYTRGYVIGFGEPEVPLGAYPGVQAYTAASLAAAALALAAGWHLAARLPPAAALAPAALWLAYWFGCLPLLYWRAPGFVHLDNVPLVWLFAVSAFATVLLGATGMAIRRRGASRDAPAERAAHPHPPVE